MNPYIYKYKRETPHILIEIKLQINFGFGVL